MLTDSSSYLPLPVGEFEFAPLDTESYGAASTGSSGEVCYDSSSRGSWDSSLQNAAKVCLYGLFRLTKMLILPYRDALKNTRRTFPHM